VLIVEIAAQGAGARANEGPYTRVRTHVMEPIAAPSAAPMAAPLAVRDAVVSPHPDSAPSKSTSDADAIMFVIVHSPV
jgi:hypothetical protein